MDSTSPSHLQLLAAEGKSFLANSQGGFDSWIVTTYQRLTATEWNQLLGLLYNLPLLTGETDDTPDKAAITLSRLKQILNLGEFRSAYQLYIPLIQSQTLSIESVTDQNLEIAKQAENDSSGDPRQNLQLALRLREMTFELNPLDVENTQVLLARALQFEDEISTQIYIHALFEAFDNYDSREVDLFSFPCLGYVFTLLLDKGYYDFFFELGEHLMPIIIEEQSRALCAFLAQMSYELSPERVNDFDNKWEIADLLNNSFPYVVWGILKDSVSDGYSILANRFLIIAETEDEHIGFYLPLLSEALVFFMASAGLDQVQSTIDKILKYLSGFSFDDVNINDDNLSDFLLAAQSIIFRVCYSLSYISDDLGMIKSYQNKGAVLFSKCVHFMASQRDFLWEEYYKKRHLLGNDESSTRKLRVGYFGISFQTHSVAYLSEETLRLHNKTNIEPFYYYFGGWKTEELALNDKMHLKFRKHTDNFRYFPRGTKSPEIASAARNDNLDIAVFTDSLTSFDACVIAGLKCAPIQISWLGGDAVGLPEYSNFFADPHILPEDAQSKYQEEIIRLPSYCAIENLDVIPISPREFRDKLKMPSDSVVLLTAAGAHKRTPECIESHLQILKGVPNGILIVKGAGEISTIINRYQSRARELHIIDRVRFLAKTNSSDEHRGQLGLVDLVLDTFPYTGATHTMEALYMGVPVLTLVGRHYYGRMSYSLLKNVGLDDCITWSIEEFIQRGIQLGNDPERINRIKKQIRDSRRWSVIWDPREQARSMEAAFSHILEGKSHETYTFHPNDLYSTPDEWNQAGIHLIRSLDADASVSKRQSTWEEALSLWRRGLARDPYHIPCWLNRIHALLVLDNRSRAFEDAYVLLEFLCTEAQDSRPSEEIDVPIWSEGEAATHLNTLTKHSYLFYLAKWMATHIGVVYRPEAMRFWSLAHSINPDDIYSALAVAVELLSQKRIEGLMPINRILNLDPTHQQASLVKQIAMWEVVPQIRTASFPAQLDVYLDYENCRFFLEPSFSSIVTRVLLTQGEWFEEEVAFCKHFLRAGMNVIDVGANVGVYTFLAARQVGSTGSVIAIEPTPSCIQCMQKTISASSLENVVFLIEAAVGDHEGTVQFQEEGASVFNSINDSEQMSNSGKEVNLVTLDSVWHSKGKPQIDLLKIDAEGAEEKVISGASELLTASHPIVIFENQHASRSTGIATARILEPLGYKFYTYSRFLNKLTKVKPLQYPVSALNIIGIHPLDLDKVSDMILG
jgi:protein O-GlcNAc transferase